MIAEYSQISTRKPQTVFKVIRGEETKRHGEASFKAEEEGCHICGTPGHFYRSCKYFNKKYSLDQNRSTGSVTDLKRKLLKVGQQVEARLQGQEELETEDQDLVTTLGRTPTLPVQLTLEPQTEPNRPE